MPFFDASKGLLNHDLWGWDVNELRFLWRFVRPGMTVLDVGAHHGLYALVAARRSGPNGRVVAFEPNPSDARRLRWHACLNGLGRLRVEPLALADRSGEVTFHVPVSGVRTTASLRRPNDSRSRFKAIQVRLDTLDHVVAAARIEQIDLIKLDVEGAEMQFLDGATDTIRRFRPLLIIESIDDVCKEWGHDGRQLLLRVQNDLGYRLFSFTDEGYLLFHEVGEVYPLISRCNYLACPVDDLGRIGNFVFI
ncbi:FkbM family methyltransferase [Cyanobium sp. ATX 6F1]|nr:FkbM family methyltransferase [Cyanobium sp. ATX 6F1]MCP9915836.1 FkbM family methyltransferase [Cyanobium sp. ATX 6F1]